MTDFSDEELLDSLKKTLKLYKIASPEYEECRKKISELESELIIAHHAPSNDGDRLDAKLFVYQQLYPLYYKEGSTKTSNEERFCLMYNKGSIPVPAWVRLHVPTMSGRTLRRWQKNMEDYNFIESPRALLQSKEIFLPEMREFVESHLVYDANRIQMFLGKIYPDQDIPSARTIQRWKREYRINNPVRATYQLDPVGYRNKFRASAGSLTHDLIEPNQRWAMDDTKADIMIDTPDGQKRFKLIICIDYFSRRLFGKFVESATAETMVQTVFRRCLMEWGTPKEVVLDNGWIYTSKYFKAALDALNIKRTLCRPYSPWEKGVVERVFRRINEELLCRLPGYVGSNVAERRKIEARSKNDEKILLSFEKVEELWEKYIQEYNVSPHTGDGMEGMSPLQKWASTPQFIAEFEEESNLDILLASNKGLRVVQKVGIHVDGLIYISPDGEWAKYIGDSVEVRYDPYFANKIYCCDPKTGMRLFIAETTQLEGFSRQEAASMAYQIQKQERLIDRTTRKLHEQVRKKEERAEIGLAEVVPMSRRKKGGKLDHLSQRKATKQPPEITINQIEQAQSDNIIQFNPPSPKTIIRGDEDFLALWEQGIAGEIIHPDDIEWMIEYIDQDPKTIELLLDSRARKIIASVKNFKAHPSISEG